MLLLPFLPWSIADSGDPGDRFVQVRENL